MKFYVHVPKPDGRWSNDYREATSDEVIHEAIRLRPTFTANHRPQVVDRERLNRFWHNYLGEDYATCAIDIDRPWWRDIEPDAGEVRQCRRHDGALAYRRARTGKWFFELPKPVFGAHEAGQDGLPRIDREHPLPPPMGPRLGMRCLHAGGSETLINRIYSNGELMRAYFMLSGQQTVDWDEGEPPPECVVAIVDQHGQPWAREVSDEA